MSNEKFEEINVKPLISLENLTRPGIIWNSNSAGRQLVLGVDGNKIITAKNVLGCIIKYIYDKSDYDRVLGTFLRVDPSFPSFEEEYEIDGRTKTIDEWVREAGV